MKSDASCMIVIALMTTAERFRLQQSLKPFHPFVSSFILSFYSGFATPITGLSRTEDPSRFVRTFTRRCEGWALEA